MTLPTMTEIVAATIALELSPAPRGLQGETGPQGPDGDEGPQGPRGYPGEQGQTGPEGPKGDDGRDGTDGEDGKRGFRGSRGERGLQGEKGDRGDVGPRGPAGNGSLFPRPGGGGGGTGTSQTALTTPFTPFGSIEATNVQDAIEEVAAEAPGIGAATGFEPPDGDVHAWYYIAEVNGALYINLGTLAAPDWTPVSGITNARADAGLQVSGTDVVTMFGATLEINAGPNPIGADILSGEEDPSDGAGVAAPVPALYLRRTPGVVGELWLKTGAADTDWTQLGTGGGTPAADPADIADPTIATAETVALKLNALMAAMRTAGSLA